MFHGTMRVWEYRGNDPYISLDPAVENVFRYQEGETVVGANVRAETECYGTADYLLKLVETENAAGTTGRLPWAIQASLSPYYGNPPGRCDSLL